MDDGPARSSGRSDGFMGDRQRHTLTLRVCVVVWWGGVRWGEVRGESGSVQSRSALVNIIKGRGGSRDQDFRGGKHYLMHSLPASFCLLITELAREPVVASALVEETRAGSLR